MKRTKTNKGITLIALIITIVVLLILAAVAVSSITNDGILHYAQNAADTWNKAGENEAGIINGYVDYLNNLNIQQCPGHTYEEGVCTNCGYPCQHDWDGEMYNYWDVRTCKVCNLECEHENFITSEHYDGAYLYDHECVYDSICTTCGVIMSEDGGHDHELTTSGVCECCGWKCTHEGADIESGTYNASNNTVTGVCSRCRLSCTITHTEHQFDDESGEMQYESVDDITHKYRNGYKCVFCGYIEWGSWEEGGHWACMDCEECGYETSYGHFIYSNGSYEDLGNGEHKGTGYCECGESGLITVIHRAGEDYECDICNP